MNQMEMQPQYGELSTELSLKPPADGSASYSIAGPTGGPLTVSPQRTSQVLATSTTAFGGLQQFPQQQLPQQQFPQQQFSPLPSVAEVTEAEIVQISGKPHMQGAGPTYVLLQPGASLAEVSCNSPVPQLVQCPHCQKRVITTTHPECGAGAWIIGALLCLTFGLFCVLIFIVAMPFCLMDIEHRCPSCGSTLGRFKNLRI